MNWTRTALFEAHRAADEDAEEAGQPRVHAVLDQQGGEDQREAEHRAHRQVDLAHRDQEGHARGDDPDVDGVLDDLLQLPPGEEVGVQHADEADQDDRGDEDAVRLDLEQSACRGRAPRFPRTPAPGARAAAGPAWPDPDPPLAPSARTLAKGVANCQTFIVIGRAPDRAPRTTKTASAGGLRDGLGSGGGTRTHNDSVNSRAFCRLNYPRMVYWGSASINAELGGFKAEW